MESRVRSILNDPISAHMRPETTQLHRKRTVTQALEEIRANPPVGRVVYFYVIDDDEKLVGVVPTRRLLLSQPDATLESIMVKSVVAVPYTATVLDACEFFTMHRLLAFPVVDEHRRILGLLDVELYTGEMMGLEERTDNSDVFQLIGVYLEPEEQKSVKAAVRKRFPWLLCNVAGGLLAAVIADAYEHVSTMVKVVPFIPVTLALAESVAIQSVSLAIQRLHGETPRWREFLPNLGREGLVGVALGIAVGATVALIAFGWKGFGDVALSLFGGIACGVTCAAVFGLAMPFLLKLLKRDPSVASGPIALAIADMLTLLAYFNLAGWLIKG
jgi:magnesium transporter